MSSLALNMAVDRTGWTMTRSVYISDKENAARWGKALASLRRMAGLSQAAAGERAGMSGQGWAKYESGQAPSIHQPSTQVRLTQALGYTPRDLERERTRLAGGGPANVIDLAAWRGSDEPAGLPIRDRVQAGAWLVADDHIQSEPARHPLARDPRFPHVRQWLSEVVGDSVDQLGIANGDLIHCVDFAEAGLGLRSGQIVEVERLRFGGSERELSVKQVELTPDGPLLWPRSSNPRWQAPLSLIEGAKDDEIEVRIRGLVVQSIKRFS